MCQREKKKKDWKCVRGCGVHLLQEQHDNWHVSLNLTPYPEQANQNHWESNGDDLPQSKWGIIWQTILFKATDLVSWDRIQAHVWAADKVLGLSDNSQPSGH